MIVPDSIPEQHEVQNRGPVKLAEDQEWSMFLLGAPFSVKLSPQSASLLEALVSPELLVETSR